MEMPCLKELKIVSVILPGKGIVMTSKTVCDFKIYFCQKKHWAILGCKGLN